MEIDIRALQQRNMSVQEFYSTMTDLWDQLALTELNELKACDAYIARREEQRLVQFLMALRNDFEGFRGSILHRSPLLYVDSIVSELLAKETRLKSYSEKGIISTMIANIPPQGYKPPQGYRPPQFDTIAVGASSSFPDPRTLAEPF